MTDEQLDEKLKGATWAEMWTSDEEDQPEDGKAEITYCEEAEEAEEEGGW